jgi:anaerobic selenocysteine-containing dehydrogenase
MQRRDFIKISAVTGATTALDACGHPEHQLIRFVPEEDLVPGVATWKPSICTLCPAGCGLMVRVMEGEAEVVRNGRLGLIKTGLAKKLEGNPNHPINQGKLCPRGQAGLQVTYHPDRIKNPLKRSGPRGSGQFQEIGWDDAIRELVSQLKVLQSSHQEEAFAFLTKPLRGQRRDLIDRFLKAYGGSPAVIFDFFDEAVLRRANALSFGRGQLPTFDLARANYVVSFGADFLGTWNSPVAHSIAYGEMRQGRPGQRSKLVMVEPRMSQTGANADEWIPARLGTEGAFALGLAHVLINEELRPASAAGNAGGWIPGWARGLPGYSPAEVEKKTGVAEAAITRIAHELTDHGPAVAMIGGAPLAQTNGLFNALAVNALNALLDAFQKPGGLWFTPQLTSAVPNPPDQAIEPSAVSLSRLTNRISPGKGMVSTVYRGRPAGQLKVLLLYDANPVFFTPAPFNVIPDSVPFIASFGSFIDETSAFADLILPDHSPLESWLDDVPESGTAQMVVSLAPPAVKPLHNTRSMPDVLLAIAQQLDGSVSKALPWKTFEEMLRRQYPELIRQAGVGGAHDADDLWKKMQEQGGWWGGLRPVSFALGGALASGEEMKDVQSAYSGPFPFFLLPYLSPLLYDGSLAHLPWLQETPDPLSTAMWGTWIEINPKTAARLGIKQGDLVEVASEYGSLQTPALIYPGIAPDVVGMPVGQGHANFTRYASGRGANPISILNPIQAPDPGSLAWAATRVKLSRVGEGKLILFGAELREKPEERR